MNEINRGSEWRKWDLHIHTPYSIKQQYGDTPIGWEKFICALENLPNEVKVIGITDYYFIDGYERVMKYKNEGRLNNIEKIFPILEFRIDTFGTASENDLQKINLHILFNVDEKDLRNEINKIKTEFIGQIPITKLPQHSTKMLSVDNLTKEAENNLADGFANLIPSTEAVLNKLKSDVWKNKTILFLGFKEWSNLEKNQQLRPFKEYLYKEVDSFFSNGVTTNTKNQNWLSQFGEKRLLHSLDIHGFDLLDTYEFDTDGNKIHIKNYCCHTWIKAQPSFEGLKQIIYEPGQRVKIQNEEPDYKEDKLIIDEVRFVSTSETEEKKFTPEPIKFNKNLNVIIGGKSSGKSILLYNIAKTLLADRKILKHKNPDNEALEYKYNFEEDGNSFDFIVKIKSGNKQSINRIDSDPSILSDIKYIPQNYLSELAEPKNKNGNEFLQLVRNLILEDPHYSSLYSEFSSKLEQNETNMENLINNYFSIKDKITSLKIELANKGSEEVLKTNITANETKVNTLKEGIGLTEEQIKEYNSYNTELEKVSIDIAKIGTDYNKIKTFNTDVKNNIIELIAKKNLALNAIETIEINQFFASEYKSIDTLLSKLEAISTLMKVNEQNQLVNESIFRRLLISKNRRKTELENLLKPFVKNQELKNQISNIEKSISEDKQKLSLIAQIKHEILTNSSALETEKIKIFELYYDNYLEYGNLITSFEDRVKKLEDDNLKIEGKTCFDFRKFRQEVAAITDMRSFNNSNFNYIYDDNKTALSAFSIDSIIADLKVMFLNIENNNYPLTKYQDAKQGCKTILSLKKGRFFDYWKVTSDNDTLDKMSTGKASFVILKLIIGLSISKSPILIDQPEDNLDNRSISKDLVRYLKEKKLERQVILVTHNPNVVVNADAENIIVANQKGQNDIESTSNYKFDYVNGALEDTFPKNFNTDLLKSMGIREHIADIVEGGKEAFKKREKKYGF